MERSYEETAEELHEEWEDEEQTEIAEMLLKIHQEGLHDLAEWVRIAMLRRQ